MDISEWIVFIAIIDGPVIALVYLIWKRLKEEIKLYEKI